MSKITRRQVLRNLHRIIDDNFASARSITAGIKYPRTLTPEMTRASRMHNDIAILAKCVLDMEMTIGGPGLDLERNED